MKTRHQLLSFALWGSLAFTLACGGGSGHHNTIASSAPNVQPITVNSGPAGDVPNGVYTSVTVCAPGSTTNCQTIDGVLVDTGSFGLRVLSSALSVSLTQQMGPTGHPVAECYPFLGGYTWGPVQTADVQISGEAAHSLPIQVLSDTDFAVPSGCTAFGLTSQDTLQTLGANGILGVGLFAPDCGTCAQSSTNPGLYYECPTSGCTVITESLQAQVQNPVPLFATDNNGVIVELPGVSGGGAASVTGSLVFGIGTQSNNGLTGVSVYTADDTASLTTTFNGTAYSGSFIDSGSNALFFPDGSIALCPSPEDFFYCPGSTANLSASNQGNLQTGPAGMPNTSGPSGTVKFSIANADSLFGGSGAAFNDLGGPVGSGSLFFDWGVPFFFGRDVYVAIAGASTPGGTGPFWAY